LRGYFQRRRIRGLNPRKSNPLYGYDAAATIIQKCVRGFLVRKSFHRFEQRLNTQILCFLQQIDLISSEFFNKIVKTNYFVPTKSLETSSFNHKYAQKFSQYLFPPPPPLPVPSLSSSSGVILSPPLPPPNAPTSIKPAIIPSSIVLPPPPPALILAARPTPQSRHSAANHNRSPSPSSVSSASKFAQVRDIFARAEVAPTVHRHHVPIKQPAPQQTHYVAPLIERGRSPAKSNTVLDAVQEYQRQHIHNPQAVYKRFAHLGGGGGGGGLGHSRPANFSGNSGIKPRGIAAFISNNKPILQNKHHPHQSQLQSPVLPPPPPLLTQSSVMSNYISSSPRQSLKPVSRVIKIENLFLFRAFTSCFLDNCSETFESFFLKRTVRHQRFRYILL